MKRANWIGAPHFFNLNQACNVLAQAFGYHFYLVGSSMKRRDFRDVDVRCILPDEEYAVLFPRAPNNPQYNARWSVLSIALSEWLSKRSDLPVDFQFQAQSTANRTYPGQRRSALGLFFDARPDPAPEE